MTQKYVDCLIAEAIQECESMAEYRILLVIAMEQFNLDVPNTVDRLRILLAVYLINFDCHYENLQSSLIHLNRLSSTVSSSDSQ